MAHQWKDATCTEPGTCMLCGLTEGEPLAHDFLPATLDAPRTCSVCGYTEGSPVSVGIIELSFLNDSEASYIVNPDICVGVYPEEEDFVDLIFYDFDGRVLHDQTIDRRSPEAGYNGYSASFSDSSYLVSIDDADGGMARIELYNYEFEKIFEKKIDSNDLYYNGELPYLENVSHDGIVKIYKSKSDEPLLYVDTVNKKECSEKEYKDAVARNNEDNSGDDSEDNSGANEYESITPFSLLGYALASRDGECYDLIDRDMNLIGENVIEGKSAAIYSPGTNVFVVTKKDDSRVFMYVEAAD